MKSFILFLCVFSLFSPAFAQELQTDILVVGGSQSGVTAAIQAARMGSKVVLVSESDWLGGSMIEAGVSAIDGNELLAFQTGLWGEFLNKLAGKDPHLLQYGWVSLFTFNPQTGKQIMTEWIEAEPNITWIKNLSPQEVLFEQGHKFRKVIGVKFSDQSTIKAKVTIEATERGDLLALGKIRHRLGWEYAGEYNEPSAPEKKSKIMKRYPLQELTWVFYLKDYGENGKAPLIQTPAGYSYEKASKRYWCAFENKKLIKNKDFFYNLLNPSWAYTYKKAEKYTRFFTPESFITYGQVSPELFMINWPKCGNDYSLGIERAFSENAKEREEFYQEARVYSLWFAKYIQDTLGQRFGLAEEVFPSRKANNQIGGFAYIPYNREARRLEGFETLAENDILPKLSEEEFAVYSPESIAIGNYANDHHYYEMADPKSEKYFKLAPKSLQWGGRYTGTPFSIPYGALLPVKDNGLIVAEKSWSVSHIANGSSRLQPVCLLIGQAAGAAASLAAQKNIQPFDLNIKDLQASLLNDSKAPPTLIPFFDLQPDEPYRAAIQRLVLANIIEFPKDGHFKPHQKISQSEFETWAQKAGLTIDKIDILFPEGKFPPSLTRAEAAQFIETSTKSFSQMPSSSRSGQSIANYPAETYCANLKIGGNSKSFKLENLKTKSGQPIMRKTPFSVNKANTAGAITFDPEVYEFFLKNASKEPKPVCFRAAYNHSGAWMLVLEILENNN